jgi:hypothetical protein
VDLAKATIFLFLQHGDSPPTPEHNHDTGAQVSCHAEVEQSGMDAPMHSLNGEKTCAFVTDQIDGYVLVEP